MQILKIYKQNKLKLQKFEERKQIAWLIVAIIIMAIQFRWNA